MWRAPMASTRKPSSPTAAAAQRSSSPTTRSVPDVFRGKGIGRLLATRMVEDARREGVKIFVLCPFVNAERQKHPDWADVFQN